MGSPPARQPLRAPPVKLARLRFLQWHRSLLLGRRSVRWSDRTPSCSIPTTMTLSPVRRRRRPVAARSLVEVARLPAFLFQPNAASRQGLKERLLGKGQFWGKDPPPKNLASGDHRRADGKRDPDILEVGGFASPVAHPRVKGPRPIG